MARNRSGQHWWPHRRHRGRREQPLDHLRRVRHGWHLEIGQQRHDLDANLRRIPGLFDRRHRHRAIEPRHPLRRHRRGQQPAELLIWRRRLQVDRRRQDIRSGRPREDTKHRADRRPPEKSRHRLRCRDGPPLWSQSRARPVQDDGRRKDVDEHEIHRQRHRLHRRRHRSVESQHVCTPPRTNAAGCRGASTARDREAESGRPPTAVRAGPG